MGTICKIQRKKGVVYQARVRKDGITIKESFRTEAQAKSWAKRQEIAIEDEKFQPKLKRHTLGEAIDKFIAEVLVLNPNKDTRAMQITQLLWFKAYFGEQYRLAQLTREGLWDARQAVLAGKRFSKFRAKAKDKPRDPQTVNRYFQVLSRMLTVATTEWGWIRSFPKLAKLEEPPGRTRFLTDEEAGKILGLIEKEPDDHRLVILTLMMTGARLGEVCKLRWNQLDLGKGVIHFRQTKSKHDRSQTMHPYLFERYREWRNRKGSHSVEGNAFVFPTNAPALSKLGHIDDHVGRLFSQLMDKHGMPDVTCHTLRHTYASWNTQDGFGDRRLSGALGHRNEKTTGRYAHLFTEVYDPLSANIGRRLNLEAKKDETLH